MTHVSFVTQGELLILKMSSTTPGLAPCPQGELHNPWVSSAIPGRILEGELYDLNVSSLIPG